jgi:hypothetical protein
MAKDFMNWRMRMSLRLLGMPQRKKSAVTRAKGISTPEATSGEEAEDVLFEDGAIFTLSITPSTIWRES